MAGTLAALSVTLPARADEAANLSVASGLSQKRKQNGQDACCVAQRHGQTVLKSNMRNAPSAPYGAVLARPMR